MKSLFYYSMRSTKKAFKNERPDMYGFLEENMNLLKVYMMQRRGFPDYIMIGKNEIPNGFMECKCIKGDIRKPKDIEPYEYLSRPQQINVDTFVEAGYNVYAAITFRGAWSIHIYRFVGEEE